MPESFKVLIKELQSIGLDIRVLSGDSKEIIIHDDDDDDDKVVRKKAEDMGVEVGAYGDHEVKAPEPEPEPEDDIIAEDMEPTDEDMAALDALNPDNFNLEEIENNSDEFSNDIAKNGVTARFLVDL